MKCENCPLAFWQNENPEYGEYEFICAVTMSEVSDEDSCRRTNKWINSQNIEEVKDRYWEKESKCYEKYMKEQEELTPKFCGCKGYCIFNRTRSSECTYEEKCPYIEEIKALERFEYCGGIDQLLNDNERRQQGD